MRAIHASIDSLAFMISPSTTYFWILLPNLLQTCLGWAFLDAPWRGAIALSCDPKLFHDAEPKMLVMFGVWDP
jgi:hypothetical protein